MLCKSILLYSFLFKVELHAASRAGYEYVAEADAWLRLHIVPATWLDARLRCHLEGKSVQVIAFIGVHAFISKGDFISMDGGVLASPTTGAMATAMTAMMAAHKLSMGSAFIGVHAFISRGDFMSMDGVPLANLSLQWREGEPNNVNYNEDCLVMTGTGELVDFACTSVHHYFCRKESHKMIFNKCGTTATGYQLESRTGSCYKFHLVPRTWHRAAMACHAEGGHLVVINSNTEDQVLKEIFEKNPTTSIKGAHPNIAHVGFWDWAEHGEWLTVFGETLSEAGFEGWGTNEPNNAGGDEFCGSIKRDGSLNDMPCNKLLTFICEITPN